MSQTVSISTRVPQEFRDRLDVIAQALQRDRAWIVEEAVRRYVVEEEQFIAAVAQGRADIEAGRFTDWEEVEAELDRILAAPQAS